MQAAASPCGRGGAMKFVSRASELTPVNRDFDPCQEPQRFPTLAGDFQHRQNRPDRGHRGCCCWKHRNRGGLIRMSPNPNHLQEATRC